MSTALRYQPPVGRFGRDVRAAVQIDDAREAMENDDGRFETVQYEVDADAVAMAIINRLLAGRTLPAPRPGDA
jgi:hypothetical protein